MPRHSWLSWVLPLVLLSFSLSCPAKPVPEVSEPVVELAEVLPPPYRIAIASSREPGAISGLPEGMVVTIAMGSGRLGSSSPAWKALVELAEDETVRAIVVADAPIGTAALFTELKERRPELVLLAFLPKEAPLVIQAAADVVLDFDHVMRAYTSALMASRMGRSLIISLSMPGSGDDWRLNTRQTVLRAASADLGLTIRTLAVAPDSLEKALSGLGMEVTTGSGMGTVSGTEVALVVNDGKLASEALRIADLSGALFIELDRPEEGYAGQSAWVLPSGGLPGENPVRVMIDMARNVPGRSGLTLVWPGEVAPIMELGALAYAKSILDGKPVSEVNLAAVMNGVWPAGQWHVSHFVDPQSGVRARNHMVTGSDPYLVGRSYLSSESKHMPMNYRMAPR